MNGTPKVTRILDYKCGKYNAKKMSAKLDDLLTPQTPDADYVRQTLLYSHVAYMQKNQISDIKHQTSVIEPHLYFTSQNLTGDSTHEQFSALVQKMVENIVREREFAQCEACSPHCPFLRLCGRKAPKF